MAALTIDNAIDYLLAKELVSVESILWGHLTIEDVARRNRNLRIERKDGPSYLIKQTDDPHSNAVQTLNLEASFYELCQRDKRFKDMRPFMPRLLHYDPRGPLFALALVSDAEPSWEFVNRTFSDQFPTEPLANLGTILGTLHRVSTPVVAKKDPATAFLGKSLPWIFRVHRPQPHLLSSISQANYQTLRILQQQDALCQNLDVLAKRWHSTSVIHGDVKSDNLLVLFDAADRVTSARLVDWELVQCGDPAWDLAGALQDALFLWISSMPLQSGQPVEQLVTGARYSLDSIKPALRAMWRAYRDAAGLAKSAANELLERAVAFAAARLIQSAYENAHDAQQLPSGSILMLQLSANILTDPEQAQVELFGLWKALGHD